MPEEWRDIDGYEGFYQVSSKGRVRRLGRVQRRRQRCRDGLWHEQDYFCKGRILAPGVGSHGYLTVALSRDSKSKTQLVHRLVAAAFIPNPEGLPQINHKDGVRTNDVVSNLEWSDQSQQELHKIYTLGHTNESLVGAPRAVRNVTTGETYVSLNAAHRATGISLHTLFSLLNSDRVWKDGSSWEYVLQ